MLNHLLIRNLAVVDEVEVELDGGLTVLTGETGAGKSIMVDALALALGERADSEAVRPGAERAEVSASFDIAPDSAAARWLGEQELATEGDCVMRRIVTAEGRSRGYINGNTVPMQLLRQLGELLVDICGQQAHQSLGRPATQRQLLDNHGGLTDQVAAVRAAHGEWLRLQEEYTALESARADREARLELLQFQVQELTALDARPGEIEELEQAHRRAANASKLATGVSGALQALYEGTDDPTAHDLASKARTTLEALAELDPGLAGAARLLAEAEIQITEAVDTLRDYLADDSAADADLAALEDRLGAMHDLARKHRVEVAALPDLTVRLQTELERIENADGTLEKLRAAAASAASELQQLCTRLSKARAKAARELAAAVTANMRQLGMPDGTFSVALHEREAPGPAGAERIEFMVAINPGMKPGPLNKVASGGELSRVSLAIQVAASSSGDTPTLIFDEVDAGVGGGTADIVGAQLRALATRAQVLCVTHLPQVASKGHQHFRVIKLSDGSSTRTRVNALSAEERVEELARMLGGVEITSRTRDHAREMLESASAA